MKAIKGILERYGKNTQNNNFIIEFPKKINKKRVIKTAWMWHKNEAGVPGYFNISFLDALKMSWKAEKNVIKSGGAIYYPYIMAHIADIQ